MLESKFKKKERERFEKLGWKFTTFEPGAGVPQGFPDTLCISPNGYTCFTEWKKEKGAKKQPLQQYWNDRLNGMRQDAFFVYPENVEEWREYVTQRNLNPVPISGGVPIKFRK